MSRKIVYVADRQPAGGHGPMAKLFRLLFLLGVWVLVGLAALTVWGRVVA